MFFFINLVGNKRLLLKELLSKTDEEHPDYKNIQASITVVQDQVNSVNKRIRESQASNEVVSIQEKLIGDDIPVRFIFFSTFK